MANQGSTGGNRPSEWIRMPCGWQLRFKNYTPTPTYLSSPPMKIIVGPKKDYVEVANYRIFALGKLTGGDPVHHLLCLDKNDDLKEKSGYILCPAEYENICNVVYVIQRMIRYIIGSALPIHLVQPVIQAVMPSNSTFIELEQAPLQQDVVYDSTVIWVTDGDYGDIDQDFKTLTRQQAISLIQQIANITAFCHASEMAITDFTPGCFVYTNVEKTKIRYNRSYTLLIFDKAVRNNKWPGNNHFGDDDFASPEEILSKQHDSIYAGGDEYQTDIWKLGVLMYMVAFGAIPFGPKYEIMDWDPDLVPRVNAREEPVDEDLRLLIKSALTKHPMKRPSIREILENPVINTEDNLAAKILQGTWD